MTENNEAQIIEQLEKKLGIKIPKVANMGYSTVGYVVDDNGCIKELGLYESGVKSEDLELIGS